MNDKAKSVTDELRRAAKSAAPYNVAMIGASHLNEAADTIDTLSAQLAETQREAVSLAQTLFKRHYAHEPDYASGKVKWEPCDTPAGVITQIDNMVAGVRVHLAELKAARIAYANEFPLNSDGEPDVDNIHANIRSLKAQLAEAQRDSERLDWMIEQGAYVVSDPDCCDGYWLKYPRKDGTLWTQVTEHETPRAAIDAAMGERNA